jgi:hypothetical protein
MAAIILGRGFNLKSFLSELCALRFMHPLAGSREIGFWARYIVPLPLADINMIFPPFSLPPCPEHLGTL